MNEFEMKVAQLMIDIENRIKEVESLDAVLAY